MTEPERHPARVGGERRGDRWEEVRSPWDGALVGEVGVASADDVDDAIAAASDCFAELRALPTHRRAAILEATSRALRARAEELAVRITRESGKPLRYSRGEVERAAVTFHLAAGECERLRGEVEPIDLEPRAEGRLCLSVPRPLGPVTAIAPFNFPLNLVAHKVAPALAVGAPVVVKPPQQAPLTAHALADLLEESGLPPRALSVVHCPPEIGQRLVEDDRMAVLSFTGSAAVGWKLKSLAGKKRVLLELGGNAPCIVDEGTDLDAALPPILQGAWAHAGQVCIKVQRLLVHRSLHPAFLDRFVTETRRLPAGDPLDESTVIGPLVEPKHVDRVLSWIHEATSAGATLHCGGDAHGQLVHPTVLTDVPPDAKVCAEEVFGPVTVVEPFDSFDDAIATCNRGRYGLQAGVFTPRLDRALQAWRDLEYGGVMINEVPTFRVDSFPYGGAKDSGLGREGVRFAMGEMCEPKVCVVKGV